MTNLTQTAFFSKKFAIVVGSIIACVIAFLLLTTIGRSILAIFSPPKPPPATIAFGKLPPLDFTGGFRPPEKVTYTLQTVSGELPKLDEIANVFEVASPANSFGDSGNAKKKAAALKFNDTPIDTQGSLARFADTENSNRILNMNIVNGNFEIISSYLTNINVLNSKFKSQADAKKIADAFALSAKLGNVNTTDSKISSTLYKVDGSKITELNSLAGANLMAVKYGRGDIDGRKVVYDNFNNPEFWLMISGEDIVAAHNGIMDIELNKFSTYPLKGVAKAYDDLKKGNTVYNRGPVEKLGGVEISTSEAKKLKPFAEGVFPIFSVELGYFISSKYEEYLQPVYVFNSDDGLAAYVSAVDDAWVDHLGQ